MTRSDELVIYLPSGEVAPPTNPYGRLIANASVYRALARYGGYRTIHLLNRHQLPLERLARELLEQEGSAERTGMRDGRPALSGGSPLSTSAAARAGTLLSGQPYLAELAWVRRHAGKDDAYSIAGTVFAFASATHREQMMHSALAPLHEWDALICSSPSLEQTVRRTFDAWEDYLCERLGTPGTWAADAEGGGAAAPPASAIRLPRPQLPVIPFGCDVDTVQARAEDGEARRSLRAELGIAAGDVVVYSLGRLSFYDKAFPQAMFRAVEAAQRTTDVTTHFVMTGWFPDERDRGRYEAAARRYAPGVHVIFLDGNDPTVVARCWAAADVFLLLSDTILETFGQALVEAMAAGLPLVVSDWDGYRFIVRDGVDGFLVPTLGAPAGPLGETLALAQTLGAAAYPQYGGSVAQHTAVHVGRAARALSTLVASPELRRAMGASGRRRAREAFSWPVVAGQYLELFDELAGRRRASAPANQADAAAANASRRPSAPPRGHRVDPLRGDPFADFRALPTAVLDDDLMLAHTEALGPDPTLELDGLYPGMRGSAEEAARIVATLRRSGPLQLRDILEDFPPGRRPFARMTVMWLAKAGVVDWLPPA